MSLFIDMDGTAAAFIPRFLPLVKEKLGETIHYNDITTWERLDDDKYKTLMQTPGLFRDLAPVEGCQQVLQILQGDGHELFTLSASEKTAYTDKHLWVEEMLPFIPSDHICFMKCKGEVAGPGKALIDDGTHNLTDWRDNGGIAICYDRPWNQDWDGLRVRDWFELPHLLNAIRKRQVVFLSLSGSGKSTTKNLLLETGGFHNGITCTTRQSRGMERDGHDYDFITPKEFMASMESGRMSEHTNYQGNGTTYGILRQRVEAAEQTPLATAWVLNGEGLKWVQEYFGEENVTAIFLWADKETLRSRMAKRGDAEADIAKRLAAYDAEVEEGYTMADIVLDVKRMNPLQVRDAVLKRLSEV